MNRVEVVVEDSQEEEVDRDMVAGVEANAD